MKKKTIYVFASAIVITAAITSCGSSEEAKTEATEPTVAETVTNPTAEEETTAVDGKALFTSSGCVACHQAEIKTVGPSLKDIAAAYADNSAGLTAFLNGEGEAIIDPAQAAVMAPQIETTKAMSPKDKNAIVDYMLNM